MRGGAGSFCRATEHRMLVATPAAVTAELLSMKNYLHTVSTPGKDFPLQIVSTGGPPAKTAVSSLAPPAFSTTCDRSC